MITRSNKYSGKEVQFQKSATHIQWRYSGETVWNDLVPLSELSGGSASWGAISGTIASQTDLQTALGTKCPNTHAHNLADLTEKSYNSLTNKPDLSSLHSHSNKALLDTYTQSETNLASAVSLKHSNANDHTHANITALNLVSGTNTGDQDLSGKANVNHTHTKADITDFTHTHIKSEVGLANVDNTSDTNKPISTATQTALDAKQAALVSGTNIKTINGSTLLGSGDLAVSVPRTADGAYTLLANDTLAQNYAVNKVTKLTVTGNRTLTTTVPSAGSEAFTIILTSGVTSFTITFGAGFKPTGTLATGTTTARVFVVHWISDGTNLYEAGRTAAMVA